MCYQTCLFLLYGQERRLCILVPSFKLEYITWILKSVRRVEVKSGVGFFGFILGGWGVYFWRIQLYLFPWNSCSAVPGCPWTSSIEYKISLTFFFCGVVTVPWIDSKRTILAEETHCKNMKLRGMFASVCKFWSQIEWCLILISSAQY